jgi:hypothetical protein
MRRFLTWSQAGATSFSPEDKALAELLIGDRLARSFAKAVQAHPGYGQGVASAERRDFREAGRQLLRVLEEFPHSVEVRTLLQECAEMADLVPPGGMRTEDECVGDHEHGRFFLYDRELIKGFRSVFVANS